MTQLLDQDPSAGELPAVRAAPRRVTGRQVQLRRLVGLLVVVLPVVWSIHRAVPAGADVVNRGGLPLLGDLFANALTPSLDPAFLGLVIDAAGVTLAFATLGTAGALVIGLLGGLVLSDVAWSHRPPWPIRFLRLLMRGLLVATRSIHELIWALLFVSVLGLDPLVAVLAIALPFGAQTAQVFGETLDGVPSGPIRSLRHAGARPTAVLAYALVPQAAPLLLSYSFYRFECAVRSTVLLGVVGVGGLGQELVVSLQSRNWNEVWTVVGAVVVLSALVDLWSTRLRGDMAVASCSEWSVGPARRGAVDNPDETSRRGARSGSRWARASALVLLPGIVVAWLASDVTVGGLTSPRTRQLTGRLLSDLWPPQLPEGGMPVLSRVGARHRGHGDPGDARRRRPHRRDRTLGDQLTRKRHGRPLPRRHPDRPLRRLVGRTRPPAGAALDPPDRLGRHRVARPVPRHSPRGARARPLHRWDPGPPGGRGLGERGHPRAGRPARTPASGAA